MNDDDDEFELDAKRVEMLGAALLKAVNEHFDRRPGTGRGAVLEALNALGNVVGILLGGTGNAPLAREFFAEVYTSQAQLSAVDREEMQKTKN